MRIVSRVLLGLGLTAAALVALGWLGLQVESTSFPPLDSAADTPRIPIPANLPAPVLRYARAVYGETMPQVSTAIVVGRARITNNGLTMPARFRIYYDAASASYYHDFQVTWFTLPVMRVHERYLDGHSILDLPGQYVENDPYTDATANQGFWAETLAWVPAIVLGDARVRWEVIGENSARLFLPNADDIEALTVNFDPDSGLIASITALRYGNIEPGRHERWNNQVLEWVQLGDTYVPVRSQTWWNDDAPWANWQVEQVAYNVDVSARLAQFGGDIP